MSPGHYASMAEVLLTDLHRNAPGALARLRASVPRHAAATDASTAELGDARLIIARELGFPTCGSSCRSPRNPGAISTNARRRGDACARRLKPCWPATPTGWPG
jgi:hypothetical protein